MPQIKRSSLAHNDATEIWAYVARHDENAADKLIDRIDQRLTSLSFMPLSGTAMPFIGPEIRRTVVGRYSKSTIVPLMMGSRF